MPDKSPESPKIQRRQFIRTLSSGALGVAAGGSGLLTLAGCGGGGGGGGATPGGSSPGVRIATLNGQGRIQTSVLGNVGLSVQSAHQMPANVESDGSFSTTVSAEGSQLMLLTDASGGVRGLAVSVPPNSSRQNGSSLPCGIFISGQPSDDIFTSCSTAVALIFRTPGILSSDSGTTLQRLALIQQLGSFPALEGYLKDSFGNGAVALELRDETTNRLLQACITEWGVKYGLLGAANSSSGADDVTFSMDHPNTQPQTVRIDNAGWRCVRIVREQVDAGGVRIPGTMLVPVIAAMDGITPLSWGSLLSGSSLAAAESADTTAAAQSGLTASFRYWFQGPGVSLGPAVPPDLGTDTAAQVTSIIFYMLFPVLDLLGGSDKLLRAGWVMAAKVASTIGSGTESGVSFSKAEMDLSAGQPLQAAGESLDAFLSLLSWIGDHAPDFGIDQYFAGGAASLLNFLKFTSVGFAAANLSTTFVAWATYSRAGAAPIPVPVPAAPGEVGGSIE